MPMGGGQPIDPYDSFGDNRAPVGKQPINPLKKNKKKKKKKSPHPTPTQPYAPRETRYMPDTRVDCKPQYLYSPWCLLRWAQLAIGLLVMGLCTVTCNSNGMNWPACTVYINEFGRVAHGMGYAVFAGYVSMMVTIVLIVIYALNLHRAMEGAATAIERALTLVCVLLQVSLAITVSYYAGAANDDGTLHDLSRALLGGIQPNWIAAAVFAWINALVHVADLVGQCALGYPSVRHVNC